MMTYADFKIEFDRFKDESRERTRRWEEKWGRPDPRIAREKLAKLLSELEEKVRK